MTEPRWVLDDVVVSVHRMLIAEHGGSPGVREKGLLESALARPKQLYFYKDDATIFELAASYGYGLAKNHPFIDGNKRIVLAIMGIFLEINNHSLAAPEPEAVIIIEQLAAGNLSESELTQWLRDSSYSTGMIK
jgi:death-on-curing protein